MKSTEKVPEINAGLADIRAWFATELGQQLLEQEKATVDGMMESVFGYHLLQVGLLADQCFYQQSTASHKFMMLPDVVEAEGESVVAGSGMDLPFASECIDAVVLHHALDFTENPHQVLREASRVLRPGGKLIVVGFNPVSLWGFYRMLVKKRKPVPWASWFIRQRRLHDWLKLLELKEEKHEGGFYRPPLSTERWMRRLGGLESLGKKYLSHSGGFYAFLATKETFAATPVGLDWRRRLVLPLVPQSARASAKGKVQARDNKDNKPGELYFFPGTHRPNH